MACVDSIKDNVMVALLVLSPRWVQLRLQLPTVPEEKQARHESAAIAGVYAVAIGFLIQDLGAWGTPLTYSMREREKILQMFEMLCGARITNSYMRPGGVFMDAPQQFWDSLSSFIDEFPAAVDELERLLTSNEIIFSRTKGVAILTPDVGTFQETSPTSVDPLP